MKKSTLFGLMALAASAASAQYTCDPIAATVLDQGKIGSLQYIALDEAAVNAFRAQGAAVELFGPDDATQNLWVWENTLQAGDASYPGVGDHFDGYASFVVGTVGWSGAGYNINTDGGVNTTVWCDETHFHLAYMSPGTVCPSIGLVIGDGESGCGSPAKVSIGTAFTDNGVSFPAIAPAPTDDWQGIDITFAQLKKLFPSFEPAAVEKWQGNILSFLCGGVTGQTISLDAIYFYTPLSAMTEDPAGINEVNAGSAWMVTANTVNVAGAEAIEIYDLTGRRVKAAAGSTVGISDLPNGIYVARAGNEARKIVK